MRGNEIISSHKISSGLSTKPSVLQRRVAGTVIGKVTVYLPSEAKPRGKWALLVMGENLVICQEDCSNQLLVHYDTGCPRRARISFQETFMYSFI